MGQVFTNRGINNIRPLGKSRISWSDFAAGVSTTKTGRHRAGGGSHANSTPRSRSRTTFNEHDARGSAGRVTGSRRT